MRIILVLIVIILGSVAAQQLTKALAPLIPTLLILGLVLFLAAGWIKKKQKF
jgi:uncharacterized membrane protein YcaP (DUF421 family)